MSHANHPALCSSFGTFGTESERALPLSLLCGEIISIGASNDSGFRKLGLKAKLSCYGITVIRPDINCPKLSRLGSGHLSQSLPEFLRRSPFIQPYLRATYRTPISPPSCYDHPTRNLSRYNRRMNRENVSLENSIHMYQT